VQTGHPCPALRPNPGRATAALRRSAARIRAGCARYRCHRCAARNCPDAGVHTARCREVSRPCPGARTRLGWVRCARERLQLRAPPYAKDVPGTPGVLALVGGNEFNSGNEEQDRILARGAGSGPAFVVPTAAARQGPDRAVAHAQSWFRQFDLELEELPVLKRVDANSKDLAARARAGGFFYLVGGDPGLVVQVLDSSRVWTA